MKPDDEQLVKACLKKDQLAFKQLYDRYAARMYALCLRYTRSDDIAKDVLHDGFIKVFDNLHKLRDIDSLDSWIHSIMVNTAISTWHKESRTTCADIDDEIIEGTCDTSNAIFSNLDIHVILDAVRELPNAYRMTFNLCEIEEYSFDEAAKAMNITPSTVRSNLARAKQILARKLSRYKK